MDFDLYKMIEKSTAHRAIREDIVTVIQNKPSLFGMLLSIALDIEDKNHHKACWILELILEKNIEWLQNDLARFCQNLLLWKHDGAIRSVTKISMFIIRFHLSENKKSQPFLTDHQLQELINATFVRLSGNHKVASKAYAMRTLFEAGKLLPWIYTQLVDILEFGFSEHSSAYKAAAKDVLKGIKKSGCNLQF